jgi:hypothetical protein
MQKAEGKGDPWRWRNSWAERGHLPSIAYPLVLYRIPLYVLVRTVGIICFVIVFDVDSKYTHVWFLSGVVNQTEFSLRP